MNAMIVDRMKRLLQDLHGRSRELRALHEHQNKKVKDCRGNVLVAFKTCQQCFVAQAMLNGVKTLLFCNTTVVHQDADGKATERTMDWLSERFDEEGPALGLKCNDVALATIEAGEQLLAAARKAYEHALSVANEV